MSSFDKDAQFLKSNAAAMRALAGGKEHQVTYAGTDTHVGKDDVRLPALPPTATAAQKASLLNPIRVKLQRTVGEQHHRTW